MAYVPGTDVAEVVIQGSMAGQTVDNVIHFQMPDAMTTTILDALANSVIGALIDQFLITISNAYELISVKATDLTTSSSPSVTRFPATTTHGAVATAPTPNNVALVISEATDSRGRSFRGRVYVAGIPISLLSDSGSVTSGGRDAIVADWVDFIDTVEDDNGCVQVVFSRQTAGADRVTGVATEITQYSANVDLDSQRRRLKGRGA